MAYDAKTQRLISLKKLAGKAHTSNDKDLANEGLSSGITMSSITVFGQEITTTPSDASLYTITGNVEYIRFPVTFIAGSDTVSGRHGFELKLPSDYVANSSNPKAGTGVFQDDAVINASSGLLQLIPPSFATSYEAKPYYGGTSAKGSGTRIPILDGRDWYLDYFNGILFQQDPPGTGAHVENPDYVEAYLYIGDMLDTVIDSGGGGGGSGDRNAEYLVLALTGSLTAERLFDPGIGLAGTDAGAGGNYTLDIDNSVVATLTGSQFSGNVGITGSLGVESPAYFNLGLSGSLTTLTDSTPYLLSGAGISITTGSSGAVTIASTGTTGLSRTKDVYNVTGAVAAGDPYDVYEPDFSGVSYDFDKIDIFLNGQLLHSGSAAQVGSIEADYYIDTSTSLIFSFDIILNDVLDVVIFTVSS